MDKNSIRERSRPRPADAGLIPLIVTVNLFFVGLTWGHADHYSQIPTLWNYLDPTFLADDWYIDTLHNLNVRESFLHLAAPVAKIIGTPHFTCYYRSCSFQQ